MSVNHLFSKSPTNLASHQKLESLHSSAVIEMEHPLIIPLQGAATTALANPHEIFPVPLLNQQLLVPLAAFQTSNAEPLSLVTAQPDSPSSSLNSKSNKLPQSAIHIMSPSPQIGMNLVVTKTDTNSVPRITDSIYSQVLNQPAHNQSKSILNQNTPVQYMRNKSVTKKDKILNATITQDLKTELNNEELLALKSIKSTSKGNVSSCNMSATDLSNSSRQVPSNQEADILKSSNDNIPTELDSGSLSKVISSLPPGWKVVGLTHLPDGTHPTPVVDTRDNITCRANAASGDYASHSPSPSHHRCGVPEVVSVDLNIPTTFSLSADVFNDCLDKKRDENNILPIDLATKSHAVSKTSLFSSPSSTLDTNTGLNLCQIKIKEEVDTMEKSDVCTEASQNQFDLEMVKNEWKVIGLTTSSLPQTSVTDKTLQMSNAPLPFPLLFSSDAEESTEEKLNNSRSSKAATILNVPTPKLLQQSVKPLSPQMATSLSNNLNDDVRWTIVGVTMASTTNITASSDAISISATKVKDVNPENVKAACTVTNSQQRPVSSSESKSAPLSSETNQKGMDSTKKIEDKWKVIGITHSPYENQVTPIPPINYQNPVPLPQLQQTCPIVSVSSSATSETKRVSNNSAATISPTACLSASTNVLNNAMSCIPPSLLTSPTDQSNTLLEQQQQLLLNLVHNQLHLQLQQQQHEQRQLMMSQLQSQLAFQSQIPFMNSMNEWNLVGLLSNIPPMISQNNQPEIQDLKKKTNAIDKPAVSDSTPKNIVSKEVLVSSTTKMNKNNESPSSDSKKSRHCKNRDIAHRFTKKNTVSHLLKLKRMKMRAEGEDGTLSLSDQEGYEVDKNMKQVKEQMELLNKSDKAIRSRPLHSYAGNRKIFSKSFSSQKGEGKQKISLRSGNQVPVNDADFSYDEKNWSEEREELPTPMNGNSEVCNESPPPVDIRSSARKRKLKIPRKMVADVDYQPFDSSSDSN